MKLIFQSSLARDGNLKIVRCDRSCFEEENSVYLNLMTPELTVCELLAN